jgi:hypothetical protein
MMGGIMKDQDDSKSQDKQQETITRKEFLKKIGVGAGAVGIGMATGETAFAAIDPSDGSRVAIQHLVRHLLQYPDAAGEFLVNPHAIAAGFGVKLNDQEVQKIQEGLIRISRGKGGEGGQTTAPQQPGQKQLRREGAEPWLKGGFSKFGTGWTHTAKPPPKKAF